MSVVLNEKHITYRQLSSFVNEILQQKNLKCLSNNKKMLVLSKIQ